MSTQTLSRVPGVVAPRATAAAQGPGVWSRVWRALEQAGMRRARHQLDQLASFYEITRPELARQLREASRHSLDA